jgi:hypothetical protein
MAFPVGTSAPAGAVVRGPTATRISRMRRGPEAQEWNYSDRHWAGIAIKPSPALVQMAGRSRIAIRCNKLTLFKIGLVRSPRIESGAHHFHNPLTGR